MNIGSPGLPLKNSSLLSNLDGLHNLGVRISMLRSMIAKLN
jgi:hypothetical protein